MRALPSVSAWFSLLALLGDGRTHGRFTFLPLKARRAPESSGAHATRGAWKTRSAVSSVAAVHSRETGRTR